MLAVVRRYMPEDMAAQFVASELADPSPTLVLYRSSRSLADRRFLRQLTSGNRRTTLAGDVDHYPG